MKQNIYIYISSTYSDFWKIGYYFAGNRCWDTFFLCFSFYPRLFSGLETLLSLFEHHYFLFFSSLTRCCDQEVQGSQIEFGKFRKAWSIPFTWCWCNHDEVPYWIEDAEIRPDHFQFSSCRFSRKGRWLLCNSVSSLNTVISCITFSYPYEIFVFFSNSMLSIVSAKLGKTLASFLVL